MKKGVDFIGVGVGAVILNHEGKIFLAKRGSEARNERNKWECPGGGVEFGDTLEETLVREMKEEYGFEVEPVELLDVCNHILSQESQHWVSPAFICRVKSGFPKIMEPHKCEEIGWYTLDQAEKMNLTEVTKYNLINLKNKYKDLRISGLYV